MQQDVNNDKLTSKSKKTEFYVNNDELVKEIKEYYVTDNFSSKLGKMILMIATNLRYKPNFINYTYEDDMISDAVFNMNKAISLKKFDFNVGKCPYCNNKIRLIPDDDEYFATPYLVDCDKCGREVIPVLYKPFDYLTTIANYAFINRIKVEKKNNTRKTEYTQRMYDEIMIDNPEYNIYIKQTTSNNEDFDSDE